MKRPSFLTSSIILFFILVFGVLSAYQLFLRPYSLVEIKNGDWQWIQLHMYINKVTIAALLMFFTSLTGIFATLLIGINGLFAPQKSNLKHRVIQIISIVLCAFFLVFTFYDLTGTMLR